MQDWHPTLLASTPPDWTSPAIDSGRTPAVFELCHFHIVQNIVVLALRWPRMAVVAGSPCLVNPRWGSHASRVQNPELDLLA
jgi:hypothetical protein